MSVSTAIESAWLWIILRRRVGGIDDRRVLDGAARTLIAALLMAAAAGGFLVLLPDLPVLFRALGAMGIGAVVFAVAALLLDVEEIEMIPRLLMRRVTKKSLNHRVRRDTEKG